MGKRRERVRACEIRVTKGGVVVVVCKAEKSAAVERCVRKVVALVMGEPISVSAMQQSSGREC